MSLYPYKQLVYCHNCLEMQCPYTHTTSNCQKDSTAITTLQLWTLPVLCHIGGYWLNNVLHLDNWPKSRDPLYANA